MKINDFLKKGIVIIQMGSYNIIIQVQPFSQIEGNGSFFKTFMQTVAHL